MLLPKETFGNCVAVVERTACKTFLKLFPNLFINPAEIAVIVFVGNQKKNLKVKYPGEFVHCVKP